MRSRGDLMIWVARLLAAQDLKTAKSAESGIRESAAAYLNDIEQGVASGLDRVDVNDAMLPAGANGPLSDFSDEIIVRLNGMLPWAAMTVDGQGRVLGSAWSPNKRSRVQNLVEPRHTAFDAIFPLKGKHILEVGCFEGIHTIGCINLGAKVTAVDSRIENLVKTLVRLWCYDKSADVRLWNLEDDAPAYIPVHWDILHHIGVLYHLTDPVAHLSIALARTGDALLLDTHVATDEAHANMAYEARGKSFRYFHYGERSESPFAGVKDHAKWLLLDDLTGLISDQGFEDVRVVSDRAEGNGRRVTIWAFRNPI